jgi:hypothetical protein
MSLNSKKGQTFTEGDSSKEAMAQAMQDNPLKNNNLNVDQFVSDLSIKKSSKERKQSVSITMTPTMKAQLLDLAKQNGYSGLSEFAVDVFQKMIDYNN